MSSPADEPRHPIAAVSRRTGLSQQILRAWERRYGMVVPQRTPTGRRLYTDRDLEVLALLKRLIDAGYRVGSLQQRTVPELREMVAEELGSAAPTRTAPASGDVAGLQQAALTAVSDMAPDRLEAVLRQAAIALPRPVLRAGLLHPLLDEIGRRWQKGELRIAHEHMASAVIRAFVLALNPERRTATHGRPVLAGTTPGQRHELGLLLAVSHVQDLGWDVVYLGADLPVEEFVSTARQCDAAAVLVSYVYPAHDPIAAGAIRDLGALLPADCTLIIGGQAAASYADAVVESGALLVGGYEDLDTALNRIPA
ncbi:MAG TPA: MerR family transcriptional regulator [Candidatus Krumholzibacteria bacterium]|nr:MerR family transcriptional regulator [Candidatus Krumholzibacteria bacterium]